MCFTYVFFHNAVSSIFVTRVSIHLSSSEILKLEFMADGGQNQVLSWLPYLLDSFFYVFSLIPRLKIGNNCIRCQANLLVPGHSASEVRIMSAFMCLKDWISHIEFGPLRRWFCQYSLIYFNLYDLPSHLN